MAEVPASDQAPPKPSVAPRPAKRVTISESTPTTPMTPTTTAVVSTTSTSTSKGSPSSKPLVGEKVAFDLSGAQEANVAERQLKAVMMTLNQYFEHDEYFRNRGTFPIHSLDELFIACADGVVFCRLAMFVMPGCIPPTKIARDVDLSFIRQRVATRSKRGADNTRSVFYITQNLNQFRTAAKAIVECANLKLTTEDILDINHVALLRALITVLRSAIVARVNLLHNFALIRLRNPGEAVDVFQLLTPEALIIRWVNYHLYRALHPTRITNLTSDLKDSGIILLLLRQVVPAAKLDLEAIDHALNIPAHRPERPVLLSETVARLGCAADISVEDIITGDRAALLTLLAAVFYRYPGLEFPSEEEFKDMEQTTRTLRARVKELEGKVEFSNQNNNLMSELDELTSQLARLKDENTKLGQQVALTQSENAYLKDKVDQTTDAVERERARSRADRESLREHNRAEIERIRKELLARQLQGLDARFKGIADTYEEMLAMKDRVIAELRALRAEAEDDLTDERARWGPAEQSMAEMQEALEKLKQDLERADKEAAEAAAAAAAPAAASSTTKTNTSIAPSSAEDDETGSTAGDADSNRSKKGKKGKKHLEDCDGEEVEEGGHTVSVKSEKKKTVTIQMDSLQANLDELNAQLEEEEKNMDESARDQPDDVGKRSGHTKKILEELYTILEDYLGVGTVQHDVGESLSSRVKNLVMALLKAHQDLTFIHQELEKRWYRKREVDLLMKRRLDTYIVDQIKTGKKDKGKEASKALAFFG